MLVVREASLCLCGVVPASVVFEIPSEMNAFFGNCQILVLLCWWAAILALNVSSMNEKRGEKMWMHFLCCFSIRVGYGWEWNGARLQLSFFILFIAHKILKFAKKKVVNLEDLINLFFFCCCCFFELTNDLKFCSF